jgi:hypothetical protein
MNMTSSNISFDEYRNAALGCSDEQVMNVVNSGFATSTNAYADRFGRGTNTGILAALAGRQMSTQQEAFRSVAAERGLI